MASCPVVGKVLRAVEPVGPGVRVDAGVTTGDEVTVHYDPMIAKLIVLGEDRADALRKMDWALSHYVLLGLTTNIPFLRAVIGHEVFRRGEAATDFVDRYLGQLAAAGRRSARPGVGRRGAVGTAGGRSRGRHGGGRRRQGSGRSLQPVAAFGRVSRRTRTDNAA